MNQTQFFAIETYMKSCMTDSAHDTAHVYRVLYTALQIAKTEKQVDLDVLISACLLHDIGRPEQFADPDLCHAAVGSEKAYHFLINAGYSPSFASHVRDCILTHRFRKNLPPQSIEAKILFDADKIDAVGAIGIARTLLYHGELNDPLYMLLPNGAVSDGRTDPQHTFFQEYCFKLEKLYDRFFTETGKMMADNRRQHAVSFYNNLLDEISTTYITGPSILDEYWTV